MDPIDPILIQRRSERSVPLDPRTKLFVALIVSTIMIVGDGRGALAVVQPILAAVPAFLFVLLGRYGAAAKYAVLYALTKIVPLLVITHTDLTVLVLAAGIVGALGRMLPGIFVGYFLVATTTVSEFIAAAERMHLPQALVIPISVMFRFFPTTVEEYGSIKDAMRMRGIQGVRNPMAMMEYRLVPLLMSIVNIGGELSASAITRGLDSPRPRTNACVIGFGWPDALAFALGSISLAAFVLQMFVR